MTHQAEIPNPALDAVLSAIGLPSLLDAQGHRERVDAIFDSNVSRFVGRYPQHKLLTHLCEAARQGLVEDYIARHRGLNGEGLM